MVSNRPKNKKTNDVQTETEKQWEALLIPSERKVKFQKPNVWVKSSNYFSEGKLFLTLQKEMNKKKIYALTTELRIPAVNDRNNTAICDSSL